VTDTPKSPVRRSAKSASLQDVATAAGVSLMTVSRAVNGRPWVSEATRDLVLGVAKELGYRPSHGARAMASGRVESVTVITANTTLYGPATTLQGIEEAARANGFSVGILVLDSAEPAIVRRAVEHIDAMTGVIVIAWDLATKRALTMIPPALAVAAIVEPANVRKVTGARAWLDDQAGSHIATQYLLDLGHPTVHHVPLPASRPTSPREAGWRRALQERGIEAPAPEIGGWDSHTGYHAGQRLARDRDVSAVLCGNDDIALGVLRAMHEAGREVPGSVSVVGFDDAPHASFLTPALTTVRLDFNSVGREAFRLLQTVLSHPRADSEVIMSKPELIVRESSARYQPRRKSGATGAQKPSGR
jgi:DNA-binding LacI/PurR family transcriptional regulator